MAPLHEQVEISDSGDGGQLVFATLGWPGWQAELDGKAVPVQRTKIGMLMVKVPPGASGTLDVTFRPPGLTAGLGAAGIGTLGAPRPRRGRLAPPPSPAARTRVRFLTWSGTGRTSKLPVSFAVDEGDIMGRLCQTEGLNDDQAEILKAVRTFVEEKILPVATELEHADEYPTEIVEGLKELGIFGLMIPEEYDGLGESLLTYALCVEEIARGWMSVSGVINTHFIVAYMLMQHGTEEQKQKYLPRMATGEVRGAFSMSEPVAGLRRRGDQDQGHQAGRRRRLLDHRPEDVADQRRLLDPGRGAGEDRRGRRLASTRT